MTSEERPEKSPPEPQPDAVPVSTEQALAEARQKAEEYMDGWKRAQADYSNLKRRTDQDKLEMAKYANTQLILDLLPVLDDFERAFQNMPHRMAKNDWAEGFRLIASKLQAILEAQGVKTIDALEKPFDPVRHEAVLHGKGKEGIVVQELRKGYTLFDKVIRPTQAVVGNGEKDEPPAKQDINHINTDSKER